MPKRGELIDDVDEERRRCARLLKALVDSVQTPTALMLVITAEKIVAGPNCTDLVKAERERCVRIVDTATTLDFRSSPATWALNAILTGVDVEQPFSKTS